jgi:acyl-CoA thioester hydrolase
VAEANLRFRSPARYDDVLELKASVVRLGRTSITTEIDVVRDDEVLVEGVLRHVFVDTGTWAKTEMPDWIAEGLRQFAAPDAERA